MKKVIIVDYGMGNLFSVQQACLNVGLQTIISGDAKTLQNCDALILPGVGSFKEAMANLEKFNLIEPLKKAVAEGKPFLGVCLGMQLLFSESEEFGCTRGLGLISGKVVKFPEQDREGKIIKVPQINWNTIQYPNRKNEFENPLLKGVNGNEYMYFVHSFYVVNNEESTISCVTNYGGITYCSGLAKQNIFAFQFHPEKSANSGLKMYTNFKNLIENGTR